MKNLSVIKIGGKIIDDPVALNDCLDAFQSLEGDKILVHGGGKAGSRMLEALNIPVKYHQGRRITDSDTLRVVTMVYAGELNKHIVAKLQSKGCNAIGLSGCDGNIIHAQKRKIKDIDYGFAGDIEHIDTKTIKGLFNLGLTPVINPITHDGHGQLLNTNADTITSTIGENLSNDYEVTLHYCFEMNGVLEDLDNPDSVIENISSLNFEKLKESGAISSGMIPKLFNAFKGLEKGIKSVTIGNNIHFVGDQRHTKITL